jgi:hypothetical protein
MGVYRTAAPPRWGKRGKRRGEKGGEKGGRESGVFRR